MHIWSRRIIIQWLLGCLLAACSGGQVGDLSYSAEARGEGNQVAVLRDGSRDKYTVQVTSAPGIGQAVLAWWGALPPHPLQFQIYTTGLENFSLTWAAQTVKVSVNATNHSVTESLQMQDHDEVAIASDSPFWIDVRIPSQTEAPYQLTAPPAFMRDAPTIWGLSWIDFYR